MTAFHSNSQCTLQVQATRTPHMFLSHKSHPHIPHTCTFSHSHTIHTLPQAYSFSSPALPHATRCKCTDKHGSTVQQAAPDLNISSWSLDSVCIGLTSLSFRCEGCTWLGFRDGGLLPLLGGICCAYFTDKQTSCNQKRSCSKQTGFASLENQGDIACACIQQQRGACKLRVHRSS